MSLSRLPFFPRIKLYGSPSSKRFAVGKSIPAASRYFVYLVLLSLCLFKPSDAYASIQIVESGHPRAAVVIAEEPATIARYAADELVEYIHKSTGVSLPVVTENAIPDGYPYLIFVGETEAARRAGLDVQDLPQDTFIIRTSGNHLYVLGRQDPSYVKIFPDQGPFVYDSILPGGYQIEASSPNGTLYGVYELVEQLLGVRWLWPGELGTYVPKHDTVVLDQGMDIRVDPTLEFRSPSWWRLHRQVDSPDHFDERFTGRIAWLEFPQEAMDKRVRDQMVFTSRHRLGASKDRPNTVHVPQHYTWWQRFGKDHPEWFALSREGVRGPRPGEAGRPALNVANPDLHRFIVEEFWDGGDVLQLGESDTRAFCWSEESMAWDGPQKSRFPSFAAPYYRPRQVSDRYARFWKTIYDKAAEKNPDVIVTTFIYWQTFPAPEMDIQLNENIRGEFAPWTQEDMYYPMSDEADSWLREQWLKWKDTGISLSYYSNFMHGGYVMPYLSTRQVHDFLKFTMEHGSKGMFLGGFRSNWSMQGPMYYVVMRLTYKPEKTIDELREEYFSAFGPAAAEVEAYFDFWEAHSEGIDWYRPTVLTAAEDYPPEVFDRAWDLLGRALDKANASEDPQYAERVEFLVIGLEHAQLVAEFSGSLVNRKIPLDDRAAFEKAQQALRDLLEFRRTYMDTNAVDYYQAVVDEVPRVDFKTLLSPFDEVAEEPLPNVLPGAFTAWYFAKDPEGTGLDRNWQNLETVPDNWDTIEVPQTWRNTAVGDYLGFGWYLTRFFLPEDWQGSPVHLRFGGVDEQAWVWVNGHYAGEHTTQSTGKTVNQLWNAPFVLELDPAQLVYGAENTMIIRVHSSAGNAGIWQPVQIYSPR